MSRIDDDALVHLLKDAVTDTPYPPDRYDRIVAKAGAQKHRRSTQALGSLCVTLAVLGTGVAIDRGRVRQAPADVLMTALSRAEDVGTVRIEGAMTTTTPSTTFTVRFTGSVDFARGMSDMKSVAEFDGEASEPQYYRILDGFQYASIPPGSGAYEAGKRWTRSPADASDRADEAADPRAALESMRKASRAVKEIGRETVRGTRTTRYQFDVAASDYTAGAFVGSEGGTVDVWIDDDGLPRRVGQTVEVSADDLRAVAPGSTVVKDSDAASVRATYEFFDYGADVNIVAPPDSEVVDSDDPILDAPGNRQACMTARMTELGEELKAKYGSGDDITPEEMQEVIAALAESCETAK